MPKHPTIGTPAPDSAAEEEDDAFYEDMLLTFGGELEMDEQNKPYVRTAVASLYFMSDWTNSAQVSPGQYFVWYMTMMWKENLSDQERQEKYKSPLGPDTGWFFPQEFYEPLVQQYFNVTTEYLRSDPHVYSAKHQGYMIGSGGGGVGDRPAVLLESVEKDGDLRKLHIQLEYRSPGGQASENKLLTVRLLPDGGYHFESYVSIPT